MIKEMQSETKNIDEDEYIEYLLSEGSQTPVDVDASFEMKLPEWADEKMLKKAQKVWSKYYFSMMNGCLIGLISILSIPTILQVLIFTNKSSSTYTAYRRYMQTVFHTLSWYEFDLKPDTKAWESLKAVRKFHLSASNAAITKKVGMVSQKDMAITQYGFFGFMVENAEKFGIFNERDKLESLVHFWRVVGHLLGIHDKYNLCTGNYENSLKRCRAIRMKILKPSMENPPEKFGEMVKYITDSLWCFNPLVNYGSLIFQTKRLLEIEDFHYFSSERQNSNGNSEELKKLSFYSRLNLAYHVILYEYLFKVFIFRWYMNFQTILAVCFIKYFPFLAFIYFGIRKSYVSILRGVDVESSVTSP